MLMKTGFNTYNALLPSLDLGSTILFNIIEYYSILFSQP